MYFFGPIRLLVILAAIAGAVTFAVRGSAHAELESASPPANGTLTSLPPALTLVFSEEVKPGAVAVTVTGPDGKRVDDGSAAVDLNDPERTRVNVPVYAGGDGTYSVDWVAVSNLDGDETSGSYTFTVAAASGSPVGATSGTPDAVISAATEAVTATVDDDSSNNPFGSTEDFDSRAFAVSIGAGLLALAAIVGFWFIVRPRNPKYGPRSGSRRE